MTLLVSSQKGHLPYQKLNVAISVVIWLEVGVDDLPMFQSSSCYYHQLCLLLLQEYSQWLDSRGSVNFPNFQLKFCRFAAKSFGVMVSLANYV